MILWRSWIWLHSWLSSSGRLHRRMVHISMIAVANWRLHSLLQ